MATVLQLPVRNDLESYTFNVELDGTNYKFRVRYNSRSDRWYMDIAKTDDTNILAGIPILTNVDLVGAYVLADLPPGRFLAYDESGAAANAGRYDLGNNVKLLYEAQT